MTLCNSLLQMTPNTNSSHPPFLLDIRFELLKYFWSLTKNGGVKLLLLVEEDIMIGVRRRMMMNDHDVKRKTSEVEKRGWWSWTVSRDHQPSDNKRLEIAVQNRHSYWHDFMTSWSSVHTTWHHPPVTLVKKCATITSDMKIWFSWNETRWRKRE